MKFRIEYGQIQGDFYSWVHGGEYWEFPGEFSAPFKTLEQAKADAERRAEEERNVTGEPCRAQYVVNT
jgi:hypothetical protein